LERNGNEFANEQLPDGCSEYLPARAGVDVGQQDNIAGLRGHPLGPFVTLELKLVDERSHPVA